MKVTRNDVRVFLSEESGQDLIEYAVLAALVALAAFTAIHNFGKQLKQDYTKIGKKL